MKVIQQASDAAIYLRDDGLEFEIGADHMAAGRFYLAPRFGSFTEIPNYPSINEAIEAAKAWQSMQSTGQPVMGPTASSPTRRSR